MSCPTLYIIIWLLGQVYLLSLLICYPCSSFIRNKLGKACFADDAAYSDSKDLVKSTISDKILKERANEIPRNYVYDSYQKANINYGCIVFFHTKTGSGIIVNEHLAEQLQKSANKKFKRRNIWAADLTEMEILLSKNKNAKYLRITDAFTKYAWVKP